MVQVVMRRHAGSNSTSRSALRVELRQERGGGFDLFLIQLHGDSGHRAGFRFFPLGPRLKFVESTDDKLRGFRRNTGVEASNCVAGSASAGVACEASSTLVAATILAITRPASAATLVHHGILTLREQSRRCRSSHRNSTYSTWGARRK